MDGGRGRWARWEGGLAIICSTLSAKATDSANVTRLPVEI